MRLLLDPTPLKVSRDFRFLWSGQAVSFLGSAVMGLLYDRSVPAVVVFGAVAQLAAAVMFFWLRTALAAAREAAG